MSKSASQLSQFLVGVEKPFFAFHINDSAFISNSNGSSDSRIAITTKEFNSLGNVFDHIGLKRKFQFDVVSLGEAVALGVYQRSVACRVDFIQVRKDFSENIKLEMRGWDVN